MIRAIVVMGVSGSGKSTLGAALAKALNWPFVEGDALHPPQNIEKMSAGIALDDTDRIPFLDNVAKVLADSRPDGVVISCSALKRSYRARLRSAEPNVLFVLPVVSREQLQARLRARGSHFMPASLLDSQLATLEPLQSDELSIETVGDEPLKRQLQEVLNALRSSIRPQGAGL